MKTERLVRKLSKLPRQEILLAQTKMVAMGLVRSSQILDMFRKAGATRSPNRIDMQNNSKVLVSLKRKWSSH